MTTDADLLAACLSVDGIVTQVTRHSTFGVAERDVLSHFA
jgi:peptide deformylase